MKIKAKIQIPIEINIDNIPENIDTVGELIRSNVGELKLENYNLQHYDVYDDDGVKLREGLDLDNHFKKSWYKPVCPRGYSDCVCDPAYIKANHSAWYHDLYGDIPPEKAILVEHGCMQRYAEDPNEEYSCYDDEDK